MALPYSSRISEIYTLTAGQVGPFTPSPAWPLYNAADLLVLRRRAGVTSELVLNTDYSVSGAGTESTGFSLTLLAGAQEGDKLLIVGARDVARTTTYTSERGTTPTFLNLDINIVYAQLQEMQREVERSFKTDRFDPDSFDFGARRLTNIGAAVDTGDAVNLGQIQTALDTATAAATASATATAVAAAGTATAAQVGAAAERTAAEAARDATEVDAATAVAAASSAQAAAAALPPIAADSMLVDNAAGTARETKTFAEVAQLLGVAAQRNRWINPACTVSQENGSSPGTTDGYYPIDQLSVHRVTSAGVVTSQIVSVVTPGGSRNRVRLTITTADASLAAGEYLFARHRVEGLRVADFLWGTPGAKQVLLRFLFKGPAGTYAIRVCNAAANRSYVALFSPAAANTDEIIEIVIPGDASGVWADDSSTGLEVSIVFACGSTFQGATGWQAGNILGTSAVSNGMATGAAVFELGDFGLYLDADATGKFPNWEVPEFATELRACQRYFQFARGANQDNGAAAATKQYSSPVNFGVSMRAAPAVAFTAITSTLVSTRAAINVTVHGLTYRTTASGGTAMLDEATLTLDARL
jgi:hypothetical protein